ncbi:hypothetical protein LAUMK191_05696 [Mycobacterium attenuatum]|uniref:Uncharacterized protein n=1 Tax=Mycobacterium attenuatum TaxID=2341086 RepID=A0A498QDZ8_9MYCO|nr:hypothetical protein LAUMK136_05666 [Mycobacterium attenuatum]VBA60888.1 hypothetical protein LAUMK191_05696 [Mycobacterium attenuatum]VBA62497.1 hypothetical protein LAUMK41_05888 [Mycobacterium attenuatum]
MVVGSVGGDDRSGFDRIAEGGAGAVGFDDIDVVESDPGVGCGLVDQLLLCGSVGGGESVGGAVLVDC